MPDKRFVIFHLKIGGIKMKTKLIVLLFILFALLKTSGSTNHPVASAKFDLTVMPFENNSEYSLLDVAEATLHKLRDLYIFDDHCIYNVLHEMAIMEKSSCENDLDPDPVFKFHGLCKGSWSINSETLEETKHFSPHLNDGNLTNIYEAISTKLGINWQDITHSDLQIPIYSAIAMGLVITKYEGRLKGDMPFRQCPYDAYRALSKTKERKFYFGYTWGNSHPNENPLTKWFYRKSCINIDVVMLVESSPNPTSLRNVTYHRSLFAVENLIKPLKLSCESPRVAVIILGDSDPNSLNILASLKTIPEHEKENQLKYSDYLLNRNIFFKRAGSLILNIPIEKIKLPATGSNTSIITGIQSAINLFRENPRSEFDTKKARKFIYFLTNSKSLSGDLQIFDNFTEIMAKEEINVQILGLVENGTDRKVSQDKLNRLVSHEKHAYLLNENDAVFLSRTAGFQIFADTLHIPLTLKISGSLGHKKNIEIKGKLVKDEVHYFKVILTDLKLRSNTKIEIQNTAKFVNCYYSFSYPLPSSAIFDGVLSPNNTISFDINIINDNEMHVSVENRQGLESGESLDMEYEYNFVVELIRTEPLAELAPEVKYSSILSIWLALLIIVIIIVTGTIAVALIVYWNRNRVVQNMSCDLNVSFQRLLAD